MPIINCTTNNSFLAVKTSRAPLLCIVHSTDRHEAGQRPINCTMKDRVEQLTALASASEDNLLAFVRCNDKIFLNPAAVDMKLPLPQQLKQYLSTAELSTGALDDIERALRTGIIEGAAKGSDDEFSDDGLEEVGWRDNPCHAWSAALKHDGTRAERGGVLTPDGQCIGPVPVLSWLNAHLLTTVELISRELVGPVGCGEPLTKDEVKAAMHYPKDRAKLLTLQLSSNLARELDEHGKAGDSRALRRALPQLLLVAHYWGELPEAWTEAEHRSEALRVAVRAASRLLEIASDPPEELLVHATAEEILADCQSLAFIASLLAEQDAQSAAHQARLDSELGIGDEEPSEEPPPSHALLDIAAAACQGT